MPIIGHNAREAGLRLFHSRSGFTCKNTARLESRYGKQMEVSLLTLLTKPIHLILTLTLVFLFDSAIVIPSSAQTHLLDDPGPTLATRFGAAPPPGVHPRILIGSKELISLRQQIRNTETGKHTLGIVESFLDVLHKPGRELAATYSGLVNGDRNSLASARNDWWRKMVPFALSMECYDVMLQQDEARGRQAASALVTLASIPESLKNNDTDLMNLALGYDFDYPYMTEAQRTIIRQTIASGTAGKKPYGAGSPADWQNYNWMPRGMNLLLSALAIEGEQGYDPSIYPSSREVMKNFLHYGISATGGGLEEMHYFHYGMHMGALALVVFARHGDDLFVEPHYRAVPNWLVASMEPFGDAFSMHQDTPADTGGLDANYVVLKWVWPNDPVVDMAWRNLVEVGYRGLDYYANWLPALLFPADPRNWPAYSGKNPQTKWGVDETAMPPGYPDPVAGIENLKLPLTYWDPERGLLITRDKWGSDGMDLNFDINAQATGGGSHYHSNSTSFTLSALKRKWAIDRGFHIAETKDNSLVLIDGRGQGFFPVGGKTVEYREDKNLTVVAGDASDAYDWMTRNKNQTGAPAVKEFHWEPDTRAANVKKYGELAAVDKSHPWMDKNAAPNYVFRAPYNTVEKAFRTAALRRGAVHSYTLILDDINKDKNSHQYDWLMQVPDDLVVKSTHDRSVILGSADPKDNRRLLVQMIRANGTGTWVLEDYEVKRSAETGDTSSFGKGKRLKYTTQTVDPAFKVLLYPYREGSPVPQVSASGALELRWPDQKDDYQLDVLASGRTAIHMRAGS